MSYRYEGCRSKIRVLAVLVPSEDLVERLCSRSLSSLLGLCWHCGVPWLVEASPLSLSSFSYLVHPEEDISSLPILNPYDEIVVVVVLLGVVASMYRLPHVSKELYSVLHR